MRIACIGGGPAGLFFALLMKKQDPSHEVTVIERNRSHDTFGWGVVFSDQTLGAVQRTDPRSAAQILDAINHWDDIEVHFKGEVIRSSGHGFCGIGRRQLLNILQDRCTEEGVRQAKAAKPEPSNSEMNPGNRRTVRCSWRAWLPGSSLPNLEAIRGKRSPIPTARGRTRPVYANLECGSWPR
jgi:2-polyprenyl-6-methoxyphenol hydroxylase-like FAD-dependent oxidoreductase